MKRKILYITGTRADYGLMEKTLKQLNQDPRFDLHLVATGMHLMPEYGRTVELLEKEGYNLHLVDVTYSHSGKDAMANFLGNFIVGLTSVVSELKPDLILILGDRAEMLGAASVGAYLSIPVAHLHGGEVTSTVDEFARHAITKLAHIHLPATIKSAERIGKMGENFKRIKIVGAPGLDNILNGEVSSKKELEALLELSLDKSTALILYHPVSMESHESANHMEQILQAVQNQGLQGILIYPNADAGSFEMIKVIEKYKNNSFFRVYRNLERVHFLGLMGVVDVMVGNSSSGIIEAPSFGIPVVNIGTRQEGRERAENILDVGNFKEEILSGLSLALSSKFKERSNNCHNPYGDGTTTQKIIEMLATVPLGRDILQKKLTY